MARIPTFCPACGRRVVREREPRRDSPAIAYWHAIADDLRSEPPQPGGERPG